MKILVTTSSFARHDPGPLDLLTRKGYEVVLNPFHRTLTKEEAMRIYGDDIDGVIAGTEIIDKDVLSNAGRLKVVSRCGTGMDNVDVGFAEANGIKVFNTADAPTGAVAELAVGLMLSLLRGIPAADRQVRNGIWKKNMGSLLCEKTVGIVGLGRIGKKTALLLKNLGARIVYCDPGAGSKSAEGFERSDMEGLLKEADIVSLHVSYSKENRNLFGVKEFSLMKKTAFLVNVSRGGIVDEQALYRALKEERIAGAAFDVFGKEPYEGPLRELDNVILTPHIGSYAKEARIKMETKASENVLKGLTEKPD